MDDIIAVINLRFQIKSENPYGKIEYNCIKLEP